MKYFNKLKYQLKYKPSERKRTSRADGIFRVGFVYVNNIIIVFYK